jgi:hypothetical protein
MLGECFAILALIWGFISTLMDRGCHPVLLADGLSWSLMVIGRRCLVDAARSQRNQNPFCCQLAY